MYLYKHFTETMAGIRARAAKGKGAAASVDVTNAEETEHFAMHMIAEDTSGSMDPSLPKPRLFGTRGMSG